MTEPLDALDGKGVILKTPSLPSKKQVPLRKEHFFTWNNYTEKDIDGLLDFFEAKASKYRFQEEIGELGTPHLQGMVIFPKELRSTCWDPKSKGHYERLKKADGVYQCKEHTRKPGGRIWEKGFPKPIKHNVFWNTWNTWILNEIKNEPDNRTINWFWSEKGKMGKTQITRYLCDVMKAQFCSGGKYADVMNLIYHTDMNICNCVIFTLPKDQKNHISYSALESIKDGLVSNMKSFKNGSLIFNPPHVFVFANYPPDMDKLMPDRWNIFQIDWLKKEYLEKV